MSKETQADGRDGRLLLGAQVAILFDQVNTGTSCALGVAVTLAGGLATIGEIGARRALLWVASIAACAAAHFALQRRHAGRAPVPEEAAGWAAWFVAVCLAEGVAWGWGSVALTGQREFDVQLVAVVTTVAAAATSTAVFGAYLPAFLAFFLPAVLPYTLGSLFDRASPLEHLAHGLLLVFVVVSGATGVRSYRSMADTIRLRFASDRLALDLRRQKEIAEGADRAKSMFLAAGEPGSARRRAAAGRADPGVDGGARRPVLRPA